MSIYLICIYVLIFILTTIIGTFAFVFVYNRNKYRKVTIENLMQKKSSLYLKYDTSKKEIVINNYTYLNVDVSKIIVDISKKSDFYESVVGLKDSNNEKLTYIEKRQDLLYKFNLSYKGMNKENIILKCDYDVEKTMDSVKTKTIEDLKEIHKNSSNKNAAFYYLNIKDFNSVNQRYGQECGDYVLEVLKSRLLKIEKNNLYCSYLGSDEFAIYLNKKVSKKEAFKFIQNILKKLTMTIDIGYIAF